MLVFGFLSIIAFGACLSNSLYLDRKDAPIKAVRFPLKRQVFPRSDMPWEAKRKSGRSLSTYVANAHNGFYVTEITLGTPLDGDEPQRIQLAADTGSSNVWVNVKSSTYCSQNPSICGENGIYEPEKSTTYKPVDGEFSITYRDKSQVSGTLATDVLGIADQTMDGFQFGLADTSPSGLGVLGLGYAANGWGPITPTVSEAILNKGLINLNAYSIFLDDISASEGSLIYGGVDTYKYERLTILPIQQLVVDGKAAYQELVVNLNKATYHESVSPATKVLLDTATEEVVLPEEFVTAIYQEMKAVVGKNGGYYVPCSQADSPDTMDFDFGVAPDSVVIQVSLASLIYTSYDTGTIPGSANGDPLCTLALAQAKPDELSILGAAFLRAAYVVFDLQHNEISLGQATYTGGSSVVEIPAAGVSALSF